MGDFENTQVVNSSHRKVRSWMAFLIAISVLLITWAGIVLLNRMARPANLGLLEGELSPCPDSPNAVGSSCSDPRHAIAPLAFKGSAHAAWERLERVLVELPKTSVITTDGHYLHAIARSNWLCFTDDMEFLIEPTTNTIHLRSASRIGYSDFGVNRARIEAIRHLFQSSATDEGNTRSQND